MAQPKPNTRIRLEIVHEDASIVVVNKSPGVVTEPGKSHRDDSLLNALIARFGGKMLQMGERRDYGLLHRLDRQTSGCVASALNHDAYDAVRAQFEARTVDKRYLAIVRGRMHTGTQSVELNLEEQRVATSEGTRLISVVARAGKPARTDITVLATSTTHTIIECTPHSGRLHQIRVQLAHVGFPLEGPKRRNERSRCTRGNFRLIILREDASMQRLRSAASFTRLYAAPPSRGRLSQGAKRSAYTMKQAAP